MIVVANPGTHPEMMHIASGLINAGAEVRYLTSSNWSSDSRLERMATLRALSSWSFATNIRRRSLPEQLQSQNVVGLARTKEALFQLAMIRGSTKAAEALQKRNDCFQAEAVKFVKRLPEISCIVGQYTAARSIFEKLPADLVRVLNYPIAHHRWLMKTMQAEGDRNPKWRHLLQGHDFSDRQLSSLDREIELADYVLVPSSFAAETFIASGVPASKIRVIPLGCSSPSDVDRVPRESLPATGGKLNLVYAGQVTQRKGIGYLLDALASMDDVQLVVVGSASRGARSLLAMYDNVEYRGSQPRNELYRTLAEADLLVLPSLAEGFGLVALESMVNGTPCILSRNTFAADLIVNGENGYVLDNISSQAIAEMITKIKGERGELLRVAAAAESTARRYSWTRYERVVSASVYAISAGR